MVKEYHLPLRASIRARGKVFVYTGKPARYNETNDPAAF